MTSETGSGEDAYHIGNSIPGDVPETVPEGTNLLVVGPPMVGKQRTTLRLLAQSPRSNTASVLVTSTTSASKIEHQYRECAPGAQLSKLHVVDATGFDATKSDEDASRRMHAVSSPADLTGIGIGITKSVREIETSYVRLGLVSISTLLQYMEAERLFSFLHVLTNRVSQSGYLGVFTLDPNAHETQTIHAIKSLFDAVVELEETDSGETAATFVG